MTDNFYIVWVERELKDYLVDDKGKVIDEMSYDETSKAYGPEKFAAEYGFRIAENNFRHANKTIIEIFGVNRVAYYDLERAK